MLPMVIQTFLNRCDEVATKRRISRARLSTLIFKDGKRLAALHNGSDVGVQTLERAEKVLAELEAAAPEAAQ